MLQLGAEPWACLHITEAAPIILYIPRNVDLCGKFVLRYSILEWGRSSIQRKIRLWKLAVL